MGGCHIGRRESSGLLVLFLANPPTNCMFKGNQKTKYRLDVKKFAELGCVFCELEEMCCALVNKSWHYGKEKSILTYTKKEALSQNETVLLVIRFLRHPVREVPAGFYNG